MGHNVRFLDAFLVGQWVDNKPPTNVLVTFDTFFRVLAKVIQRRLGVRRLAASLTGMLSQEDDGQGKEADQGGH